MKKMALVGLMALAIWWAPQPTAYASTVGDAVKSVVKFAWSPVNCLGGLGAAIVQDVIHFGYCVLNNVNQPPVVDQPLFTGPEHAEGGHNI